MTDKQLDNKIRAGFDNIRANSAVRARILNSLESDHMKDKKTISNNPIIIAENNEGQVEKTERKTKTGIKVRVGSKAAAAAAAVVLALGGVYALNNSAKNIEKAPPAAEQAYVPEFNGVFDKSGYTVFDKFGKCCNVYRLNDGRFLIQQWDNHSGENAGFYDYFIYDPEVNAVVSETLTTDLWCVDVNDSSFTVYMVGFGQPADSETTAHEDGADSVSIEYKKYSFDMQLLEQNNIVIEREQGEQGNVNYTPVLVNGGSDALFLTDRALYSKSGKIFEFEGTAFEIKLSKNGGYAYFMTLNESGEQASVQLLDLDSLLANDPELSGFGLFDEGIALGNRLADYGDTVYALGLGDDWETVYAYDKNTGETTLQFDLDAFATPDYSYLDSLSIDRYLFVQYANTPSGDSDNQTYALAVYDMLDGENIFSTETEDYIDFGSTGNILFDDQSGDLCMRSSDTENESYRLTCFNVFGGEYTNFGIEDHTEISEEQIPSTEPEPLACNFDPDGYTLFDKFAGREGAAIINEPVIYQLKNNTCLVETAADGYYEYVLYDMATNSTITARGCDKQTVKVYDNGFALVQAAKKGECRELSADYYDLDFNLINSFNCSVDDDHYILGDVAFEQDGTAMYYVVNSLIGESSKVCKVNAYGAVSAVNIPIAEGTWADVQTIETAENGALAVAMAEYSETESQFLFSVIDENEIMGITYINYDGNHFLCERGGVFYCYANGDSTLTAFDTNTKSFEVKSCGSPNAKQMYISQSGRYAITTSAENDMTVVEVYDITQQGGLEGEARLMYMQQTGHQPSAVYTGANIIFDDNTGDLCMRCYINADGGRSFVANIFGEDYGNLSLGDDTAEAESAAEKTTDEQA